MTPPGRFTADFHNSPITTPVFILFTAAHILKALLRAEFRESELLFNTFARNSGLIRGDLNKNCLFIQNVGGRDCFLFMKTRRITKLFGSELNRFLAQTACNLHKEFGFERPPLDHS